MNVCRDINELTPSAQKACRLFIKKCEAEGLKLFITETYRPQSRQNELWEQGRTKPGRKVTWTLCSRHTSRMAWDVACTGDNLYDADTLEKAGQTAKSLGITWGGDWDTPDRPHFEIGLNWKEPKETQKETQKEGMTVEKRYNTVDEIPDWGKDTIRKLAEKGCFGDKEKLDLSKDMIRVLTIMDRKG